MEFSPCLDMLFRELPFRDRMQRISRLGFRWFEFWSWWDKDLEAIIAAMHELDLRLAAFCTRFISLADAARRQEYLEALRHAIGVAERTDCGVIITQVGAQLESPSRDEQKLSIIEGLADSARLLDGTKISLVIEPLNTIYDHPGYFLTRSGEALEILREVGSPNIGMLFDVYHQQASEGNLIGNLRRCGDSVRHIHVADCPGRHELGTGEINYANIFDELRLMDFRGRVGIELLPSTGDDAKALSNPLFR